MFYKIGSIWRPQADFMQQCGHLWQVGPNTTDLHRKHLSHILFVLQCVLCISFVAAW